MHDLEDVKRRLNQIILICAAMFLTALVAVVLSVGVLLSDKSEFESLTKNSYELTRRNNRLRGEAGLSQARFMAIKGEMRKLGKEDMLLSIQNILDRYADAELQNGHASEKTQDDVRREGCKQIEAANFGPCVP
jgi:hypothetical protein